MVSAILNNMSSAVQVGVKIFLRNPEGNYLLVKRSLETYKDVQGRWDIVGGRIHPGSTLIDNLRREVTEETQLRIVSEPVLIYAQDILIPESNMHVVRLSYTGTTEGEPILDTSENIEYVWVPLSEMKEWHDLDPYVHEIVTKGLVA
jgi:ADP-ribose pyrophosphatase YjhB (NUDIX family)